MAAWIMPLIPIALLCLSNVFMTTAWYWHLKYPHTVLWHVVLISWMLALVEYSFAVPANRIGYQYYSAATLKTIQEVITLAVFIVFSVFYLDEKITLQHIVGFAFICLGAGVIFYAPK